MYWTIVGSSVVQGHYFEHGAKKMKYTVIYLHRSKSKKEMFDSFGQGFFIKKGH